MDFKKKLFQAIQDGKIELVGRVESVGGGANVFLDSNQIEAFIEDPIQFVADKNGVFKSQYVDWIETGGTPRCGAKTKSGNRCKNIVSGGVQQPLERWLQEDGGFCTIHGGETSEEAQIS